MTDYTDDLPSFLAAKVAGDRHLFSSSMQVWRIGSDGTAIRSRTGSGPGSGGGGTTNPTTLVTLVIRGQSNSYRGGPPVSPDDDYAANIQMANAAGTAALPAAHPMIIGVGTSADNGFLPAFLTEMAALGEITPAMTVIVVHGGSGGTAYHPTKAGGEWSVGGSLHEALITRHNDLIAALAPASHSVLAVLEQQMGGDAVASASVTAAEYEPFYVAAQADLRARLTGATAQTPIVQMGAFHFTTLTQQAAYPTMLDILDYQNTIPDSVAYSAYVSLNRPYELRKEDPGVDILHFDAVNARLSGRRMARLGYIQASTNDLVAAVPDKIGAVEILSNSTGVLIQWDPPASKGSRVSSVVVEVREQGTTPWTVIPTHGQTPLRTMALLPNMAILSANTHELRVSSVNDTGQSLPSDIVTFTVDPLHRALTGWFPILGHLQFTSPSATLTTLEDWSGNNNTGTPRFLRVQAAPSGIWRKESLARVGGGTSEIKVANTLQDIGGGNSRFSIQQWFRFIGTGSAQQQLGGSAVEDPSDDRWSWTIQPPDEQTNVVSGANRLACGTNSDTANGGKNHLGLVVDTNFVNEGVYCVLLSYDGATGTATHYVDGVNVASGVLPTTIKSGYSTQLRRFVTSGLHLNSDGKGYRIMDGIAVNDAQALQLYQETRDFDWVTES